MLCVERSKLPPTVAASVDVASLVSIGAQLKKDIESVGSAPAQESLELRRRNLVSAIAQLENKQVVGYRSRPIRLVESVQGKTACANMVPACCRGDQSQQQQLGAAAAVDAGGQQQVRGTSLGG